MLGIEEKIVMKEEFELQKFAKRSIQAICNISKGEKLILDQNFSILRPGNQKRGTEPRHIHKIHGKKARRKIKFGHGIRFDDCI